MANAVVQLNEKTENKSFIACFMVVTEIKDWGVIGYVSVPGKGAAYYRAKSGTFDLIGETNFVLSQ